MRKIVSLLLVLSLMLTGFAQNIIHVHNGSNVVFEKNVSEIDSIKFQGPSSIFNFGNNQLAFPCNQIDSITFSDQLLLTSQDIYITWNGNSVSIINPLDTAGVTINVNDAKVDVNVTSDIQDIVYHLSGNTPDGYLYITPNKRFTLSLEGVSITNSEGPAIQVLVNKKTNVILANGSENYLSDGSGSSKKGALQSKSEIIFNGNGTLTVDGIKKNGIHSDDYVQINGGHIVVVSAAADGIHCDYFLMSGGTLDITSSGDGIDGDEGYIAIDNGTINITTPTADCKSVKCDSTLIINGGKITIANSGDQSKGLKSKHSIFINGGEIDITASGSTVLEDVDGANDPSYCTGIACDGPIHINGGHTTITLPASNSGGRGISGDDTIAIAGGTLDITTAGNGTVYTVSGSTKDAYTCSCIKSNVGVDLIGGRITCSSTGTGGKGINSDGYINIGTLQADDSLLILNVTTSGAHVTVSSGGGGGWPGGPGSEGEYANPKGIKAEGNLTVNSGIVNVNCTQATEGGECMESKQELTINGGQLTLVSDYDDALNAGTRLSINGGTTYAASTHNDAIDSNGELYITGGLTIASSANAPEEAFDADNNTFAITGGTIIGVGPSGGMFTSPTASACTQHSMKYTGSSNNAVQIIRSSDNAVLLTFQLPTLSGGGGGPGHGGGPGGSSSAVLTFSSPDLVQGSYTLKYGGTISGGNNFHNYYTGATYTGGNSKTFNIGSSYSITTVN